MGSNAQKSIDAKYNNYFQSLIELFRKDTALINIEAYQLHSQHEGKVIDKIIILQEDFKFENENIQEKMMEKVNDILNNTHTFSTESTIRKNIFFKEGDLLNTDLLTASERYLRSLDFIQEVTFKTINTDTGIIIIILIKDIYAYSPNIDQLAITQQYIGLSNINFQGKGNRVGINLYRDQKRAPTLSWEVFGQVLNLKNSLISLNGFYSRTNKNLYNHLRDEEAIEFQFVLPLAHEQKKWTGAAHLGHRRSLNRYADQFQTGINPYSYLLGDLWIGFNLNTVIKNKTKLKHLIALRYFNYHFTKQLVNIPETYVGDIRYLNRQGILASLTLFKQIYFKTKYVYNFGIAEDIPTGHNLKITLGYINQNIAHRPYTGVEYYRYKLTQRGDLLHLFLKTSAYYGQNSIQDWGFFTGISSYLKLISFNQYHLRNYYRFSFGRINNYRLHEPLLINQEFGIYGVQSELAQGKTRVSFRSESFLYFPKKLLGFNYAAIFITDLSYLAHPIPNQTIAQKQGIFMGIGTGIRLKNEQLGLNNIEIRASILPKKLIGDDLFYFSILTNLNFSHTNKYVTAPSPANYNGDPEHLTF